jgi:uncharacterized protein (DUF924 family)
MFSPETVLKFWFDETKTIEERLHLWFGGTPEIDSDIRTRFEREVITAAQGKYQEWEETPESCLALIVLLDQFPLNIYRDQARSFGLIEHALPVAIRAIDQGFDRKVRPMQRLFYYLPLEHSEDLSHQKRCVELCERLVAEASPHEKKYMEVFLDYAIKHLVVIERFGRYPDRNEILGRPHTPEEADYVAQGGPPF